MRRVLAVLVVMLLGLALTFGCAQRKIAAPADQQKTAADQGKGTQQQGNTTDQTSKGTQKEAVTEKQIAKAQPSQPETSLVEIESKLKDVYFDFDRYDIREDARPVLKDVAALLSKYNTAKVMVEGHCDERGTSEYNLSLGEKRANAVKEYLLSLGIPSSRIQTVSYGKEKPVCTESTEECWAKNRRAHFVLVKEKA